MLDVVHAFIFIFVVALLSMLVGAILGLPIALYNKLRRRRFGVDRGTRIGLSIGGIAIVVWLMVSLGQGDVYTARAQVSEGVSLASQYKTKLAEYFAAHKSLDAVSIADFDGVNSGRYVSSVTFSGAHGDRIAVVATFHPENSDRKIRGKEFRIATVDGGATWVCGMQIPEAELRGKAQVSIKLLPPDCR